MANLCDRCFGDFLAECKKDIIQTLSVIFTCLIVSVLCFLIFQRKEELVGQAGDELWQAQNQLSLLVDSELILAV